MYLSPVQKRLFFALVILIIAVDTTTLIFLAHGNWEVRLNFVFQILAFYGIGLGLAARSNASHGLKTFTEGMTSANIFSFVADNLRLIAVLWTMMGLSIQGQSPQSPTLAKLGGCLCIILFPTILLYTFFHLFVVMPLTYIAFLFASALVASVEHASNDKELTLISGKSGEVRTKFKFRELVKEDPVATKSFLIGIPAAILALVSKFADAFL